jgi:MFS family permease
LAPPPSAEESAPSGIGITALILRRPEFLAYLTAATCTITSLWLLETTLQWVVLTSSGSSALVGAVYVAIFIPIVILVVPVGLAIDRYGAKPLLLASQVVWCCLMVAGATLDHFGRMNSQVVLVLAVLDGVCNAMWTVPAQVILGRVVRKELMASAIGLGLLQFAAGRIIGGSLAAATLSMAGPTAALLLGAASAGIGAAAALRVRENRSLERRSMSPPWPAEIGQAFAWTIRSAPAVALFALGGITALFTVAYLTVLPAVSRSILHAGPAGLGLMTAVGGVGLAVAAFVTDPLGRVVGRGATICLALGCTAIALAILGISASLVVSVALVGAIAGCLGVFSATNNSLLQALSPPEMRGRVLAFYGLTVWLIFPLAAFGIGVLVDRFGASLVLEAMGALTLVSVVVLLLAYRPLSKLDIGLSGAAQLRTRPVIR